MRSIPAENTSFGLHVSFEIMYLVGTSAS